jgi:hypothetical protein
VASARTCETNACAATTDCKHSPASTRGSALDCFRRQCAAIHSSRAPGRVGHRPSQGCGLARVRRWRLCGRSWPLREPDRRRRSPSRRHRRRARSEPPDPKRVYRNYVAQCRRLDVTPTPRDRARKLVKEWTDALAAAARSNPPTKH